MQNPSAIAVVWCLCFGTGVLTLPIHWQACLFLSPSELSLDGFRM